MLDQKKVVKASIVQSKKEDIQQAAKYFHYFAERVNSVFWVRDTTCNEQLYLSPGYEKVWKRTRESLYADPNSWINTLYPADQTGHTPAERCEILKIEGPGTEYVDRYRIILPSGELRWVKDTSFPIYDANQTFIGFAGIAEDITESVLYEQALQEEKQRAEVANKAKSDFLAMMSHELRTPLNAILGMAQIMKLKGLPEAFHDYANIIVQSGDHLLSLVNDVLDFARLEVGKLSFHDEVFNLYDLLLGLTHSMGHQANQKGVALTLHYSSDAPLAMESDPNRIRQMIVNLLSNAIKFTEQGQIELIVNFIKEESNDYLEISVRDTGIGIPPEKVQGVFERFNQLNSDYQRKYGGIGLGLSITKQLAESLDGSISVDSVIGQGSHFRVKLPWKPVELESNKKPSWMKRPYELNQLKSLYAESRVLLVEDNPINQQVARVMLEELGCQVAILEDGQSVLLKTHQLLDYSILLIDVGLPDLSGFEVVEKLRQVPSLKNFPIIAMTAHVLESDKQQSYLVGINQIIPKPIHFDELASVLGEYLTPINVS